MPNVTEAQMAAYLRAFRAEYVEAVERHVPAELREQLFQYALRQAPLVGFVSTQLGAGWEIKPGDSGMIEVRRGSARVEDLIFEAPASVRDTGPMILAQAGSEATFGRLGFAGEFPFRFSGSPAWVRFIDIRASAGSWQRDILYAELSTERDEDNWSEAQAIRRAGREVLAAVVDLHQVATRRITLEEYLTGFKDRNVLLLGDFRSGRGRLQRIRGELETRGYAPVLLDEIADDPHYDLGQKFQAVASVCRFLVFEDSTPAGQIRELELAANLRSITIVLREEGNVSSFMAVGGELTSTVLREWSYSAGNFGAVLDGALEWAEQRIADLKTARQDIYPWRRPSV